MKNNFTKVLATLLTLCMLMGMMIVPTVAESAQTDGVITPDTSWYTDAETEEIVYELYDAADLLGFAALGNEGVTFKGATVKLMADIDLNPGWDASTVVASNNTVTLASAPANVFPEIPVFEGIFDGQSHVISGMYSLRTFKSKISKGAFVTDLKYGTIKNVIFVNGLSVGKSDTTFGSADMHIAGLVGNLIGGTVQSVYLDVDVWWDGSVSNYHGSPCGVVGSIDAVTCTVDDVVYAGCYGAIANDGTYSSKLGGQIYYAGIIGPNPASKYANELGDIAILATHYDNEKQAGSSISHKTQNRYISVAGLYANNDSDCDGIAEDLSTKCTIYYDNGSNMAWGEAMSEESYADRGWKTITLADTQYDIPVSNTYKTYQILPGSVVDMILASDFVVNTTGANEAVSADTSWYTGAETEEITYYVYDAADMYGLSVLANEGETFEGVVIKLMADIDLNPDWNYTSATSDDLALKSAFNKPDPANDWVPLEKFCGTFDGNGHTIKHMFSDVEVSSKLAENRANGFDGGFVKELNGGQLKNFVITESTFVCTNTAKYGSGDMYFGGLVGLASGSNPYIGNIYADFEAYFVTNYHFAFAGIVVYAENTTITVENIVFAGKLANISNSGVVGSTNTSVCYGPYGIIGHGGSDTATRILTNILSTPNLVPQSEEYNKGVRPTNIYNATHVKNVTESNCYSAAVTTAVDGWTYVESKATYMPATVAAMLAANTQNLYLQKSVDGNAVRFIGVVNLTEAEMENFSSLGFNLSMTYNGKTYTKTYTTTTVYTSLIANGTTVDVSELGGTYFYAVEINGLDAAEGTVVFNVDGITVQAGETTTNVYGSVTVEYTK